MKKKYSKYILFQKILIFLFIQSFSVKSFPFNDTDSNIIINKCLRKNSKEEFNIPNKDNSIIMGPENSNFISSYVDEDGQLFIETFSNKTSNKRYIYSLLNNGREFYTNSINEIMTLENSLNTKNMNSIILRIEEGHFLLNIFYGESNNYFELLNISSNSNNNYYKPNENLMNLKILSNVNSLFKLSNNLLFFSYFTRDINILLEKYHLKLIRGTIKFLSDSFDITYKDTLFESINLNYFNSTCCFETTKYINCLNLVYSIKYYLKILIFDKDGEDDRCNGDCSIDNSILPYQSNIFRKGIYLKDEISAYIFFQNSGKKPILSIQNFAPGILKILTLSDILKTELNDVEDLDNNCDLNDIIRINENRFVFISTTTDRIKNIILLFDLYNGNKSLMMRKYLLNLQGRKTNTNLRLFLFIGFIGFSSCFKNEKNQCSFSLLSYGNTTDYPKVDDFLMKLDLNQNYNPLNLEENIHIENNLFGYEYVGTRIISVPNKDETGLFIMNSQNKKEIKINDILYHNSIIFSYVANNTIIEGDYIIEFTPIVNEKSSFLDKYSSLNKIYGTNKNQDSFSKNYTGRHGQFIFNIENHDDFYCHQNCYSCFKKSISDDDQFCVICKESFYFIENTYNCFKDPFGYYLNNEKQVYSKCHSNCTKCSKGPIPGNMNCDECKEEFNLDIDDNNNIRNCYICHNSFYYIYNEETNKKEKICLEDNEFCPEMKPYEIIETKECNLTCSYENLINLICKPSNIKIVADQMKNILKEQIITNNEMVDSILNDTFEDITIDGYNSTYQISTTKNQKINIENNDGISTIDLNECEKILKQSLNLSDNISLILLKEDLKLNISSLTQVEYEVYDPFSRTKFDLDKCKGLTITINTPVEIDEDTLKLYKNLEELGYNPFDPNDPFYNDECTVYTTENGTDMILTDRKNDILYQIPSPCEKGCDSKGINTQTQKAICECSPKNIINSTLSSDNFQFSELKDHILNIENKINYKVLFCFRLLKDYNNLIHNYGFYIMSLILLCFIILMPVNLSKSSENLKIKCSRIISRRQTIDSKCRDNLKKLEINSTMSSNTKLKKVEKIKRKKKNPLQRRKPRKSQPLKLKINKIETLKENEIFDLDKKSTMKNNTSQKDRKYSTNTNINKVVPPIKNLSKFCPKKNNTIKVSSLRNSTKTSKSNRRKKKFFTQRLSLDLNSKSVLRNSNNDILSKENTNRKQKNSMDLNETKRESSKIEMQSIFLENCIKYIPKEERSNIFNEEELNKMDYKYAIELDKRDFITYYFSLLKLKHLIIFTFLIKEDYNVYLMKISLFLCSLALYLITNTIFFNDENMHEIYTYEGKYNFIYQLPFILYTTIISVFFNNLLNLLSLSQRNILKLKQLDQTKIMVKQMFSSLKIFKLKIVLFNIIGLIILMFGWYYLTMFCAVYTNTQIHLLKDIFSSFGLSLVYPFGINLIPGFFRIYALRAPNKNRKWLYKLSQLISLI